MESLNWLGYHEADYLIKNFQFENGQVTEDLKLHYFTMGEKSFDADNKISNAVLLLHNTTGSGKYWLQPNVANELFGNEQCIDLKKYYVIVPDLIGFGQSSKPSDGLRGNFPNYRYIDLVRLTHQLLTEVLGITHLKLIVGISMGGMLTWMIAGMYPDFTELAMPISCQPGPISGRNWIQRRISIEAIRNDPGWNDGMYEVNPSHFAFAAPIGPMMLRSLVKLQQTAPTRKEADKFYWEFVERAKNSDANDRLFQLEASMDYDPTNIIEGIKARVLTVSFADDELNPISLGVVDRVIAQIDNARHEIVPASAETFGHLSGSHAKLWSRYLEELLEI